MPVKLSQPILACVDCKHCGYESSKPVCRRAEAVGKWDFVEGRRAPLSAYAMRASKAACGPDAALYEAKRRPVRDNMLAVAMVAAATPAVLYSFPGNIAAQIGAAWDVLCGRVSAALAAFNSVKDNATPAPIEPAIPMPDDRSHPDHPQHEDAAAHPDHPDHQVPDPSPLPQDDPGDASPGVLVPQPQPEPEQKPPYGQGLAVGVTVAALVLLAGIMGAQIASDLATAGSLPPCKLGWSGESCCHKLPDGTTECWRCRKA